MGKTSWLTPSTGVKMHKEYMCNLLLFLMPKYARFHRVMTSIVRGFLWNIREACAGHCYNTKADAARVNIATAG